MFLGDRNRYEKPLKTTLDVAEKYAETYPSSIEAGSTTPRGKGTTDQFIINKLQHKLSHTKITKEKVNRATTDGPRMT